MIKKGDKIISDLDGLEYEVVDFGDSNNLDPIPGVKRLGNIALVKDKKGNTHMLYEWEFSK